MTAYEQLLQSMIHRVEGGRPCALCVVVSTRGSTPQTAGATLILHPDGTAEGTLGGGCVEAEVLKKARQMLANGQSGLLQFKLDHDYGWDDGLICGGNMDIAVKTVSTPEGLTPFRETLARMQAQSSAEMALHLDQDNRKIEYRIYYEKTPTLLIAGAGHVGTETARLATRLDFRTVVIDDRADLLTPERLPAPIETQAGDIAATLKHWPIDNNTYVVIVTRGHHHDEEALHAVIESSAKYIGLIGSRRKIKLIFDDLAEAGIAPERLEQVHSPIGLAIGAVTVPEIAVSIAAELVQVRRAEGRKKMVEGPFEVGTPTGQP